jgi:hypothetical protein
MYLILVTCLTIVLVQMPAKRRPILHVFIKNSSAINDDHCQVCMNPTKIVDINKQYAFALF